jgi:hypothetical protein
MSRKRMFCWRRFDLQISEPPSGHRNLVPIDNERAQREPFNFLGSLREQLANAAIVAATKRTQQGRTRPQFYRFVPPQ